MKHTSPPKMQWNWFSPSTAKHLSPPLRSAVEVAAEVPAARPLADVAADRPLVAELRAGGRGRRLGERRVALGDVRVRGDLGERGQRADAQRRRRRARLMPRSSAMPREAHQRVGGEDAVAQAPEQVRAAGVHAGAGGGAKLQRFA